LGCIYKHEEPAGRPADWTIPFFGFCNLASNTIFVNTLFKTFNHQIYLYEYKLSFSQTRAKPPSAASPSTATSAAAASRTCSTKHGYKILKVLFNL
jgi:hypothetical protein